jgi:hypothetical protein
MSEDLNQIYCGRSLDMKTRPSPEPQALSTGYNKSQYKLHFRFSSSSYERAYSKMPFKQIEYERLEYSSY